MNRFKLHLEVCWPLSFSTGGKHCLLNTDFLLTYSAGLTVLFFNLSDFQDAEAFKLAPKGSLRHFVYHNKTNHSNPCFLQDYLSGAKEGEPSNFFVFFYDKLMGIIKVLNRLNRDIFENKQKIYDSDHSVFFLRKRLPKEIKQSFNHG